MHSSRFSPIVFILLLLSVATPIVKLPQTALAQVNQEHQAEAIRLNNEGE